MKRINTEKKAIVLLLGYVVLTMFLALSIAYMSRVVAEVHDSRRKYELAKAFWVAEAGAADAYINIRSNRNWDPASLSNTTITNMGTFNVTVQSPSASIRKVIVTGTTDDGYEKTITYSLSYGSFQTALAAGNKLIHMGLFSVLDLHGDAKAGNGIEQSPLSWITTHEDEGYTYDWSANPDPKIIYPDGDTDTNTIADEFSDFNDYTQESLNEYEASEVVWIQTDNDVTIWPGTSGSGRIWVGGTLLTDAEGDPVELAGIKMLYVQGTTPETSGLTEIHFGASETFSQDEDLTIVSTGNISYKEPLQSGDSNSRLSVITWQNYKEEGILYTNHNLNVFAHGAVDFVSFLNYSDTKGIYLTNNDMELLVAASIKRLYLPSEENLVLPPGWEGFPEISQGNIFGTTNGTPNNDWQEL